MGSSPSRQEYLQENKRLRAKNERLEVENAVLGQEGSNEIVKEISAPAEEESRPRKKQRTTHQHGHSHCSHNPLKEQQQVTAVDSILMLPRELLGRALDFLEFSERRDFFTCGSRELWKRVRIEYETLVMCDLILDRAPRLGFLSHDFTSVCRLNFESHCSDTALAVLCNERAFPQLTHLAMAGSTSVTDYGLSLLTENSNRRKNLLSLDITSCNGTTPEGAFSLRDLLVNLQVLRRQPEWMDGQILHPNGNRVVYWPDGIFAQYGVNGVMKRCAYIRNLFEEGSSDRVVCKRQLSWHPAFQDEWWQSQPEWVPHAYRLGSTLSYLPDTQSVMIASAVRGVFPIQGFPRPEDAHLIRINTGCYFNRQGEACARNHPSRYTWVVHHCMQPLDTLMPPQDVLNHCCDHIERAKVVLAGRQLEDDERDVHRRLGGNRNDVPPPYWFQHD